jgi:hypothetical protein
MRTKEGWRKHLRDVVSVGLDPTVYAVQWADDPRCMQSGAGHRRVGEFASMRMPVCRLWSLTSRKWV